MIKLCNTCVDANVPLDLVDNIVGIIHDGQNNGLKIDSNIVRSREYFLKHLNKCFKVPLPETVKGAIEDTFGEDQTIKVIRHDFLYYKPLITYMTRKYGVTKAILLELLVWKSHLTHSNMDVVMVKLMKLLMVHGTRKRFMSVQKLLKENVSWFFN